MGSFQSSGLNAAAVLQVPSLDAMVFMETIWYTPQRRFLTHPIFLNHAR